MRKYVADTIFAKYYVILACVDILSFLSLIIKS